MFRVLSVFHRSVCGLQLCLSAIMVRAGNVSNKLNIYQQIWRSLRAVTALPTASTHAKYTAFFSTLFIVSNMNFAFYILCVF